MHKHIAVLAGDGIGPEIVAEGVKVLKKVGEKFGIQFSFTEGLVGAAAIDAVGDPYPYETHQLCLDSHAVLFGAIGDPRFDNDPSAKVRPEQGILAMRKSLGLYANVRPIFTFKSLIDKSPLKREIVEGAEFVVIRELTGGIYFGEPRGRSEKGDKAFDSSVYTVEEITRVSRYAFELAKKRKANGKPGKVTLVDKANVLATSRLWRETVQKMAARDYDAPVEYMFVDNAAMQLVKRPVDFDVVLTENMFGDILTDEASVITGSIGMLPSASIGEKTAVYEPIHGSYPQAKGLNIANPIGTILSAAMMLEYSFDRVDASQAVFKAVETALEQGFGTTDIVSDGKEPLSTSQMGDKIVELL
jgi:3-isopropylmalate dehydrogenase